MATAITPTAAPAPAPAPATPTSIPTGTSTQGLSPWAAPYVTDLLGKAAAAGSEPVANTIYGGDLTAGPSDIQNQVFNGIGGLTFPSNLGQSFTNTGAPSVPQTMGTGLNTGTTGSGAGITGLNGTPSTTATSAGNNMSIAAQYMNPYLQNVLNPQMQDLRENAQSAMNAQLGKLTSQGAYGGGRQAVMQGASNRDLLQELNKTAGAGYANAYDKGMGQFNTEQKQGLDLGTFMANQGKTQRDIDAEGTTADLKEFERQRDYDKNNVKFMRDMLGPGTLPIQETTSYPQQLSGFASIVGALGGYDNLVKLLGGQTGGSGTKGAWTLDDLLGKLGFGSNAAPSP